MSFVTLALVVVVSGRAPARGSSLTMGRTTCFEEETSFGREGIENLSGAGCDNT
jgi:hypothetical protein